MKYFKRLKLYKSSSVIFNPKTNVATSYDWWEFTKVINGKLVFNSYSYSSSTSNHQSKVRLLLRELNIAIDVIIHSHKGFQDSECLPAAIDNYNNKIIELKALITKPRSQSKKNAERLKEIESYQNKITEVKNLMVFDVNARINEIKIYTIDDLIKDYYSKTRGHWFDKDTLRFFSSIINDELFFDRELIYFVSSEKRYTEKRLYTVRSYNPSNGYIDNIGGFQAHLTMKQAKNSIKNLLVKAA